MCLCRHRTSRDRSTCATEQDLRSLPSVSVLRAKSVETISHQLYLAGVLSCAFLCSLHKTSIDNSYRPREDLCKYIRREPGEICIYMYLAGVAYYTLKCDVFRCFWIRVLEC